MNSYTNEGQIRIVGHNDWVPAKIIAGHKANNWRIVSGPFQEANLPGCKPAIHPEYGAVFFLVRDKTGLYRDPLSGTTFEMERFWSAGGKPNRRRRRRSRITVP